MGIESAHNFARVSDTVTTSGFVTADALADLGDRGYDLVVNLLPDTNDRALAGEAGIVGAQGVEYVHIPVDFAAPDATELEAFAAVMDAHAGATVHVHCAANYRVSVFYALYAAQQGWWSDEEADAHIRSIWAPDAVWEAFIAANR